jgi:hypothetical protein
MMTSLEGEPEGFICVQNRQFTADVDLIVMNCLPAICRIQTITVYNWCSNYLRPEGNKG